MIVRDHPALSLSRQCRLLSLGRSSLYYEPKGESAETLALMRRIDELFLKYPFYGARRMALHLRREGVRIGRRRAARLMRLMGLQAIYRAPRTSAPHPEHRIYPYLLRGLAIERPNHVWCADITYIPVNRGFLYLVAIMDWASRYVLAWRLSNTLDASFCTDALDEALARHGKPEIVNTDQGSQFTSFAFTGRLQAAGIRISMDGRGRCMDNIFIERLWRSLKYEAIYLHEIADGFIARRLIGEWVRFYNLERPHAALDGRTPAEAYRGDPPVDMMDKPLRARRPPGRRPSSVFVWLGLRFPTPAERNGETTMTDDTMAFQKLLEKTSDADLLSEMICFAAERLMALEVQSLTGAGHGERTPERLTYRNGSHTATATVIGSGRPAPARSR